MYKSVRRTNRQTDHALDQYCQCFQQFRLKDNFRQKETTLTALTEPEFSVGVSKSFPIIFPLAVEIDRTILTALKHLKTIKTLNIIETRMTLEKRKAPPALSFFRFPHLTMIKNRSILSDPIQAPISITTKI